MKSPEILKRLVQRFGVLLALTVVGGVAGGVYGTVKKPTYTANAYVVAIGDPGDSINALNFAQAYGRIATTGPVIALARPSLGPDTSGLNSVTASTSPDAPVVQITATGRWPTHTALVANSMAIALVTLGNTRKGDTKVTLQVLAGATVPSRPTSPRPPLELVVGAAAGLLIGALTVLAGVGRASAARLKNAPPDYEAAQRPAPLEPYQGRLPRRAITAYRSRSSDGFDDEGIELIPLDPMPMRFDRIVGRAPVAGAEDEQFDPGGPDPIPEPVVTTSLDTTKATRINGDKPAFAASSRIVGRATVAGTEEDE